MFQSIDFSSFPKINADRETRTPTPVKAYEPESYVSANSTISAKSKMNLKHHRQETTNKNYYISKGKKFQVPKNAKLSISLVRVGYVSMFSYDLEKYFSLPER